MILADHLSKTFGGRTAVDDVSFRVAPGEVVGFLGPNGAGKTTTMRLLLGLLRPSGGTATIDGPAGYLPEVHAGYPPLSVRGYLRYLGLARGVPRRALDGEVGRVLGLTDVGDLAGRPLGRCSKGQRQRVGLAQALLGDPSNHVFDEPTIGLDPSQVASTRRLFRQLADDGAAVLISTHLLAEAAAVCDRVVVIAGGRIRADETVADAGDLEERFLSLIAQAELS